MNRIVLFAGVIAATTSLSGCSWYWETSKDIGSHMPTYEGWFGDGEKPTETQQQQLQQQQNPNQSYYNAPPELPRERRIPLSGNPAQSQYQQSAPPQQGYTYTQPQGYPPFPPTGGQPLPSAGSFPPPPGFSASDVPSANDMPPPPPGFGNAQTPQGQQGQQAGGPDPMEGLRNLQIQQQQGQQPLVPFTEPVLENFSAKVAQEAEKDRSTFSFLSDIGDVVSGWFDSEPTKEFPNLASVPDAPKYDAKMADAKEAQQELEADKQAAQAEQKAITDWSDLAEENAPSEPVTALSSITSPTGNEVVVPRDLPAEETVMPEPKTDTPKAPETVVIMRKAEPMPEPQPMPKAEEETPLVQEAREPKTDPIAEKAPEPAPVVIQEEQPTAETKPEFLRKPQAFGGANLLPRNRYSNRE